MPTDYFWNFTVRRDYDSRDLNGAADVEIAGGTPGESTVQNVHFDFWAEAQAFLAWAFAENLLKENAVSPESVARWKRLLEEARVEWAWDDEEQSHEVKSPATWEDLKREGIVREPTPEEQEQMEKLHRVAVGAAKAAGAVVLHDANDD